MYDVIVSRIDLFASALREETQNGCPQQNLPLKCDFSEKLLLFFYISRS